MLELGTNQELSRDKSNLVQVVNVHLMQLLQANDCYHYRLSLAAVFCAASSSESRSSIGRFSRIATPRIIHTCATSEINQLLPIICTEDTRQRRDVRCDCLLCLLHSRHVRQRVNHESTTCHEHSERMKQPSAHLFYDTAQQWHEAQKQPANILRTGGLGASSLHHCRPLLCWHRHWREQLSRCALVAEQQWFCGAPVLERDGRPPSAAHATARVSTE